MCNIKHKAVDGGNQQTGRKGGCSPLKGREPSKVAGQLQVFQGKQRGRGLAQFKILEWNGPLLEE